MKKEKRRAGIESVCTSENKRCRKKYGKNEMGEAAAVALSSVGDEKMSSALARMMIQLGSTLQTNID